MEPREPGHRSRRSLTGERVTRVLERLRAVRGAYDNGVRLRFIESGRPIQNAHIESFNARLREECLNEHVFVSLDDARNKIERWRVEYNRERPHSSLGNLTPEEFAAKHQMSSAIARTARPAAELELADAVQRARPQIRNLIVFRPQERRENRLFYVDWRHLVCIAGFFSLKSANFARRGRGFCN